MTACVKTICDNININISKGNKMIDKAIDIVGKTSLVIVITYAVYFYATELIRIIS